MKSRLLGYPFVLLFICLLVGTDLCRAQSDSLSSPFRKGRWLTGITGSINSIRNDLKSTDENTTSNEYALNIIGGKFIKDRWLIGGIIQANRSDAEGTTDITTETIFVGPLASHYLSDSDRGSLFLNVAPGYTRYRNLLRFTDGLIVNEEIVEGSGFGLIIGLGYSYVIFDRIAFDIGFNIGQFWVDVDREIQPGPVVVSDSINIRNIAFSFGFRVLLDRFLQ